MVTRAQLDGELARLREDGAAAAEALVADVASLKDEVHELRAGLDELRRDAADLLSQTRRRAQGAEPEPEPEPGLGGENVKIVKRSVVYCGGPGSTTNDGTFDYSQCADRAFASCHADACAGHTSGGGKHRRAQAGGTCVDVPGRSAQITAECCDEAAEDCSGGYPHTCNAGCAAIFLPFWADCRSSLGKNSAQFEPAVALCEAASPATAAPSLAEQLNVQCADGTAAADCVPECSEAYHGYLLLLNIEGEDSKLSCELHHGFYSWVGSAVRTLDLRLILPLHVPFNSPCLSLHSVFFFLFRFVLFVPLTRYHHADADGRRLPGVGLRDLLLGGRLWRRRGVRRDPRGGRGDYNGACD